MTEIAVQLDEAHLQRLAAGAPEKALAELIWNSLDADATDVQVYFELDTANAIERIHVDDNGDGINFQRVEELFGLLGGSWKRSTPATDKGQLMHGSNGEGRFKAFSLGTHVEWITSYQDTEAVRQYTIDGSAASPGRFSASDPEKSSATPGTTVVVSECFTRTSALLREDALLRLIREFAVYLMNYKDVNITIDGTNLSPYRLIERQRKLTLSVEGVTTEALPELHIVEWSEKMPRHLVLRNENGFPLAEQRLGIKTTPLVISAYLIWSEFNRSTAALADSDLRQWPLRNV